MYRAPPVKKYINKYIVIFDTYYIHYFILLVDRAIPIFGTFFCTTFNVQIRFLRRTLEKTRHLVQWYPFLHALDIPNTESNYWSKVVRDFCDIIRVLYPIYSFPILSLSLDSMVLVNVVLDQLTLTKKVMPPTLWFSWRPPLTAEF